MRREGQGVPSAISHVVLYYIRCSDSAGKEVKLSNASDEQLEARLKEPEIRKALKERGLSVERGQDKYGGLYLKRFGRIEWKMRCRPDCLVPPNPDIGEPGIYSAGKSWKLYRGDKRVKGVSGIDESIRYILDHTPLLPSQTMELF